MARWVLLCCNALLWSVLFMHLTQADDVLDALDIKSDFEEERCLVGDYGARGNGKSLDTTAIQEAIDECGAKEDGGVVELAEGLTYLSGALKLPSKVTLRLRKGSVLQASTSRDAFPASPKEWFLILAEGAKRVSIEGPGKILGQAQEWTETVGSKKVLNSWVDESCVGLFCHPSLIGIRDCSQVTIQDVDMEDFANAGIYVQHSEAVAILQARLITDEELEGPQGIIVDGSKRVFIGQTSVKCYGHCISAITTEKKVLESLLVDDVTLQSKSAAFQVGPQASSEIKTIVVENAQITSSKRGISLQLHDSADMHDIWFTNVTMKSLHMDTDSYGGGEGIFISVKPSQHSGATGKMSNLWFGNLTSQAETGFVVSGHNKSIIENVVIKETELELKKLSKIPGFFLDFRPSRDGLMNASSIPAIFLEYASHVELQGFQVVFNKPGREEWGDLMAMTPHTVHAIKMGAVSMHDESAHPSTASSVNKVSQLGEFFKHSLDDWSRALTRKGFISLQENAAFGVRGRQAASSASPLIIILLGLVLISIAAAYCCLPMMRGSSAKNGRRH